jgi:hypothetical protein
VMFSGKPFVVMSPAILTVENAACRYFAASRAIAAAWTNALGNSCPR